MTITLQFILAMSCAVPALISLIKLKKGNENYYPFFLLLWLAVVTELVADIPSMLYHNHIFMNILYPAYSIEEVTLMLIFIKRNNISIPGWLIMIAAGFGVISFSTTYLCYRIYNKEIKLWDYTAILFLAIILIQSIRLLSNQVFAINLKPFKNSLMIIAFGCVLFYSYFLLVSIFTNLNTTITLYGTIIGIHQIVNALSYLIFTWAIICIPRKVKY